MVFFHDLMLSGFMSLPVTAAEKKYFATKDPGKAGYFFIGPIYFFAITK